MREARMYGETGHRLPVAGDPTAGVERPELPQERARLRERAGGRWIEPAQRRWIGNTGSSEIERERGQIGLEDLGLGRREQLRVLLSLPKAITDSGSHSPGPAPTLIGRGATRTVTSRVMPERGEYLGTRANPESTTVRIPSMVRLVSAMEVARTTFLLPGALGRIALS